MIAFAGTEDGCVTIRLFNAVSHTISSALVAWDLRESAALHKYHVELGKSVYTLQSPAYCTGTTSSLA